MILKSTLGLDINNDTSTTTNRSEVVDDDDDNVAKKVNISWKRLFSSFCFFDSCSLNQMMI